MPHIKLKVIVTTYAPCQEGDDEQEVIRIDTGADEFYLDEMRQKLRGCELHDIGADGLRWAKSNEGTRDYYEKGYDQETEYFFNDEPRKLKHWHKIIKLITEE